MSVCMAENRPAELQTLLYSSGVVMAEIPQYATLSLPMESFQRIVEATPLPRRPNRNRSIHDDVSPADAQRLAALTPSAQSLKQLAKKNPPPQSWFEED